LGPTIDTLAKEFSGKAVVAKVKVDDARKLSGEYKIEYLPTLIFFKDGKEVDRIVGSKSKEELAEKIKSLSGS